MTWWFRRTEYEIRVVEGDDWYFTRYESNYKIAVAYYKSSVQKLAIRSPQKSVYLCKGKIGNDHKKVIRNSKLEIDDFDFTGRDQYEKRDNT